MEVDRREDSRELRSPLSPSLIHGGMHGVEALASNTSTAAKLKVVLQQPSAASNGGTFLAGEGSSSLIISGTITPLSTSSAGHALTTEKNNGLSLGGSYGANPRSSHHGEDLKLPASMELMKQRKSVKYRECLKNHAANLGGHATDGCGEFMPSGEEGTIEALICAACSCHRNFHRREMDGEPRICYDCRNDRTKALFPSPLPLPSPTLLSPPLHMIMAFNASGAAGPDSDEYDTRGLVSPNSSSLMKKRFRTKFTPEQKELMAAFAHKLGWRMQKHDEEAVQQFCAEVGVKRHVLKVWMHNNKLTMAKKVPCCLTMTPENGDTN